MKRSREFRTATLAIALSFLLVLLPMASAVAQTETRAEKIIDAARSVRIQTRSADPESMLYLGEDRFSPDMWSLESRRTDKAATDAGRFQPAQRFSLAGAMSDEMIEILRGRGVLQYDREIVVGTIYDLDGGEQLVAALRFDLVVDDGAVQESIMVPIMTGTNLEALLLIAGDLAETVISRSVPDIVTVKDFEVVPGKSTCLNHCLQEYSTDIGICTGIALACITGITGVGLACILACPATGPLVIPCLILCGVIDLSGIAGCTLTRWSCFRSAKRQLDSCKKECLGQRPVG